MKSPWSAPRVRPGKSTSDHISKILTRLTLVGAVFLGVIAILPNIISIYMGTRNFLIGGTSILIVVSVILEIVRILDVQLTQRNYDRFLN